VSNVVIGSTTSVPAPTAGGWKTNGAASLANPNLILTPATAGVAGSAFWPTAVRTGYLRASFDANIDSGNGADGLALVLADPASGATPSSIGTNGGGLGFSGIPGLAVALDTYQNAANPSGNFVGLSTGGVTPGSDHLGWLATTSAVPPLRNATVHVTVVLSAGVLTVVINGTLVLSRPVVLPPSVLVGFTGGTGGIYDRHAVSNVAISSS